MPSAVSPPIVVAKLEWTFADRINAVIDEAIEDAKKLGIHGKETTPYLLARIKDLTGGDSLASNIQLVLNNARLAAEVAKEMVY